MSFSGFRFVLLHICLLFLSASVFSQTDTGGSKPQDPVAYVERALAEMEKLSYYGNKVDWAALQKVVLEKAKGAKSTRETYPALKLAIKQLGDSHAFLYAPPDPSAPKSENKGDDSGWVVASKSGDLKATTLENGIGYVLIPSFGGQDSFDPVRSKEFALKIRAAIEKVNASEPRGWIIDLRFNSGGNMWPMLAGLTSFLPSGEIGYFEGPTGGRVPWLNAWGIVGTKSNKAVDLSDRKETRIGKKPIVVLYGKYTLSSGEAVAVALRSIPGSVSIGSKTGGAANATQPIWLGDGAMLFITTAIYVAKDGTRYGNKVTPDRLVEGGPRFVKDLDMENDPVVNKAIAVVEDLSATEENEDN